MDTRGSGHAAAGGEAPTTDGDWPPHPTGFRVRDRRAGARPPRRVETPSLAMQIHLARAFALTALLTCAADAAAAFQIRQDDARERLLLTDGEEVFGRLLWRHDPDGEVHWMLPNGRRDEFDVEDVLQIDTLNDKIAAFLAVRTPRASLDDAWALVQWARDEGLDGLARAQAYHLLTRDPQHALAHEFLGHVKRGESWRWREAGGDRLLDAEAWAQHHRDTGHMLVLHSVHWELQTTADLTHAVDMLFDLEKLYVEFHAEFGSLGGLRPQEVVKRQMVVRVYRDSERFPGMTSAKIPYYLPGLTLSPSDVPGAGSGNVVQTYYGERGNFPRKFFELASQQALYTCVLGESQTVSGGGFYRESAWLEVGFGNWFGRQFVGRPGYVERRAFELDPEHAELARARVDSPSLRRARFELTNLIGLNYEFFLQNEDEERRAIEARANTFFAFLFDENTRFTEGKREGQRTRPALLAYMRDVYLANKGGSSSALDDALGMKIEQLEEPWKQWLLQF